MNQNIAKKIVITMGDPAGIGPDIIVKSLNGRQDTSRFILIGSKEIFDKQIIKHDVNVRLKSVDTVEQALCASEICVLEPKSQYGSFTKGECDYTTSKAQFEAIDLACSICLNNKTAGLVTAPVSKHIIAKQYPSFTGHTDFLAKECKSLVFMMIRSDALKVVPLTEHIPLSKVSQTLSKDFLFNKLTFIYDTLSHNILSKNINIALAGLNPHAGDSGLIGKEEQEIFIPVLKKLKALGKYIKGPFSADTLFTPSLRSRYDCIVCPTHDQALIPIKSLYFEESINITYGLPFIRTSPAHGPAYEVSKTNDFSSLSMLKAINYISDKLD